MNIKEMFEKQVLKGTCFSTLEELQNDKTDVDVNAPRALIACELSGVWRGINIMAKTKDADLIKAVMEMKKQEPKMLPFNERDNMTDMEKQIDGWTQALEKFLELLKGDGK